MRGNDEGDPEQLFPCGGHNEMCGFGSGFEEDTGSGRGHNPPWIGIARPLVSAGKGI
jgi:hypothetical protein